jgi:hypothetical protein
MLVDPWGALCWPTGTEGEAWCWPSWTPQRCQVRLQLPALEHRVL